MKTCKCKGVDEIMNCKIEDCIGWCGDDDKEDNIVQLTEGVPTEDGWYTIITLNDESKPFYETIYFFGGRVATQRWGNNPIISYLKLPDL